MSFQRWFWAIKPLCPDSNYILFANLQLSGQVIMLRVVCLLVLLTLCQAREVIFQNNLGFTIWVGLQPNSGSAIIAAGGWKLDNGEMVIKNFPKNWVGSFWARTGCDNGTCQTADCGAVPQCNGNGAPPLTLVEIQLNGYQNMDSYDISLVHGFNVGVKISPINPRGGDCRTLSCTANVNANCPDKLRQKDGSGNTIACWASCDKTHSNADCCTGSFTNPEICLPSQSASYFKRQCPDAHSYAYDDLTTTFSCVSDIYSVTFVTR